MAAKFGKPEEMKEIRWKRNIAEVNIEYSNNNGADWKPVGKASGLSENILGLCQMM